MIFNSLEYLIFLPLVIFAVDSVRNKDFQVTILLIASYFFYFYSAGQFIFLMGIITLTSYIAGKKIVAANTEKEKKIWLFFSISVSLFLLGYFKYYIFFAENLNLLFSGIFPLIEVILPIGISFYTFEAISYVVDPKLFFQLGNKSRFNFFSSSRTFFGTSVIRSNPS